MNKNWRNIALIGMPGCGKTTIGRLASRHLNLKFYDVDEYIEDKQGMKIVKIFEKGEEYFRIVETNALMELAGISECVISTGGGVVKIHKNIDILNEGSLIVFINRPIEKIARDIDIGTRPLLAGGKSRLYQLFEERYELYKKYCHYEIMNDDGLDEAVDNVIELWKNHK